MVHWRREWQSIQYSGLENPIKYENAKDRTMNDKLIRSVGSDLILLEIYWRSVKK